MIMAPALRRRATEVASVLAGGFRLRIVDPAVVVSPATSNKLLTETGSPAIAD